MTTPWWDDGAEPLSSDEAQTVDLLRGLRKRDWVVLTDSEAFVDFEAFMPNDREGCTTSVNFDDAAGVGLQRLRRDPARNAAHGVVRVSRTTFAQPDPIRAFMPQIDWNQDPHDRHANLVYDSSLPKRRLRQIASILAVGSTVVPSAS